MPPGRNAHSSRRRIDEPLSFADGRSFQQLKVIANPRNHRTVLFRASGSGNIYRIPNIKRRSYRLVDP